MTSTGTGFGPGRPLTGQPTGGGERPSHDAGALGPSAEHTQTPSLAEIHLEAGTVLFGQWRILRALGRGGFGAVFEAEELKLDEIHAIKLLDPEMVQRKALLGRFQSEVRLMRRLVHPRIVRVFDYREDRAQRLALISMEYIRGCSVRGLLDAASSLGAAVPVRLAIAILAQTLEALAAAHSEGVIHRDVTPGNILLAGGDAGELLSEEIGDPEVKLVDFGLASLMERSELSQVAGTAPYVAPEVFDARAEVSPAADVYGAGAVAYELLTGGLPLGHFPAPSEERPGLGAATDGQMLALLARQPEERPEAAEAANAARLLCKGLRAETNLAGTASSRSPSSACPGPKARIGRKVPAGAAVLIAAVLIAAAIGAWRNWRFGPVPASCGAGPPTARMPTATGTSTEVAEQPSPIIQPDLPTMATATPRPQGTPDKSAGLSWTDPVTGMVFRLIPAQTFTMGSPPEEEGRERDEQQHGVTISRDYWMAETEVTQGQWQIVMGNNPSENLACGNACPVEQVTWFDTVKYANELSSKAGFVQCYRISGGNVRFQGFECEGYRLPTEAEWELGARAGTATPFWTGSKLTTDQANCNGYAGSRSGRRGGLTVPGTFRPNALDLYDVHGNVWEWCWDRYGEYPTGSVTDYSGPSQGGFRVIRSGGWPYEAACCRSANRGRNPPNWSSRSLGLRLVRTAQ